MADAFSNFTDVDPFNSSDDGSNDDGGDHKLYDKMMSRIMFGRKLRGNWERDFKVVKAEDFFIGNQHEFGDSQLVLNHFFALLKAQQPNLFFANPRFLVRPRPGQKELATERKRAFAESVLSSIANQDHHLEKAVRLGLTQAFFRIGVLKVTYDPQLKRNPRAGEPLPSVPGQEAPGVEPDSIVGDDVYRFEWVNSKHMILPDQGPDMDRWTWIGEEVVVTLDEAKNDHRFDKTARSLLKSNETKRYRTDTDDGFGGDVPSTNMERETHTHKLREKHTHTLRYRHTHRIRLNTLHLRHTHTLIKRDIHRERNTQ